VRPQGARDRSPAAAGDRAAPPEDGAGQRCDRAGSWPGAQPAV